MPTQLRALTNGDAILHYTALMPGTTTERKLAHKIALFEGQYYTLPDDVQGFKVDRIDYTGAVEKDVTPPYEKTAEGEAEFAEPTTDVATAKAEVDEALAELAAAKGELADTMTALNEAKAEAEAATEAAQAAKAEAEAEVAKPKGKK